MTIDVLICGADGTQTVETREVPEDWLAPAPEKAASQDGTGTAADGDSADNIAEKEATGERNPKLAPGN